MHTSLKIVRENNVMYNIIEYNELIYILSFNF